MRAVWNISFSLSKVRPDKITEVAIEMFPAALPFSFGYECQEYLWFDSQTTSTITLAPFWNILHIFTCWKQIRQTFRSVTIHDQNTTSFVPGWRFSSGCSLSKISSSSLSSNESLVGQ